MVNAPRTGTGPARAANLRSERMSDSSISATPADAPPAAPVRHERLRGGSLGMVDISAATMANIGPAMSFFFGFGFIVVTAGIASPLTIVAAVIAIALLGNTLAQFSRAQPSTGGFITFVGKTFGPTSAVTTALLAGPATSSRSRRCIAISGGFLSILLQHYFPAGTSPGSSGR
jgi:amino acid transporter